MYTNQVDFLEEDESESEDKQRIMCFKFRKV